MGTRLGHMNPIVTVILALECPMVVDLGRMYVKYSVYSYICMYEYVERGKPEIFPISSAQLRLTAVET